MPDRREEEEDELKQQQASDEEELTRALAEARRQPKVPVSKLTGVIARARKGDKAAMRKLIQHYLETAASAALDHRPSSVTRLRALQEANLVLLKLAASPPEQDFESTLEAEIRSQLRELGKKK